MTLESAERAAVERWLRRLRRHDYASLCAIGIVAKGGSISVAPEALQEALLKLARGEDLGVMWIAGGGQSYDRSDNA